MKKIEQPIHIIISIIFIVLSIVAFLYFESLIWKILVGIILLFISVANFSYAFSKKEVKKKAPTSEFRKFVDNNLASEKFFECQNCDTTEVIPLNTRLESKLYITNKIKKDFDTDIEAEIGLEKYPLLCFNCGYVSYWAEYFPPKKFPEYFEVLKLNANLKSEFIDFAKENNHSEKLEMIKSIEI